VTREHVLLSYGLTPRLLSRELAAEYCGASTWLFDETIAKEVPPIELNTRKVWDIRALDHYLDERSGLAAPALRPVDEYINQLGKKNLRR
jgi:hypothetical protein